MKYEYPFAFVVGKGGGISYSSQMRSGDLLEHNRKLGQAGVQFFANLFNQNLITFDRQIEPYDHGLPFNLYAVYNAIPEGGQPHWQFSIKKMKLVPQYPDGGTAQLIESDGHITTFTKRSGQGNLCWLPDSLGNGDPYMVRDTDKNQWAIYYPAQELVEYYDDDGLLQAVVSEQNASLKYAYNADKTIHSVTGSSGASYVFDYQVNADNSKTVKLLLNDPSAGISNQLQNEYQFDAMGRLMCSTSPSGYKTNYTYFAESAFLNKVEQDDQTQIQFRYDTYMPGGKLSEVLGWKVFYKLQKDNNTVTIHRANLGSTLTVNMNDQAQLLSVSESRGYNSDISGLTYEKSYTYNNGRIAAVTHYDGTQTLYEYGGVDIIMLAKKTEPSGRQTEYYYDKELVRHMTVKVVSDGKDQVFSHRFVYDYLDINTSDRKVLRFEISPRGAVTEHRYDQKTGLLMNSRTYLDKLFDVSAFQPQIGPGNVEMNEWIKAQDQTKVRLTTYTYDARGQHKVVKHYVNVDAQGQGVDDEFVAITQTTYDSQHNLLSRDVQYDKDYAFHREWQFDDLNRQLRQDITLNQSEKVTTAHQYEDASSKIVTTYPNQKTKQQTYSTYGSINDTVYQGESSEVAQTRDAKAYQDALGRATTNIQTDGKEDYTFYDKQNHLGYVVSNTGIVKQVQPDLAYRYTTTTEYATPISIDALFLHIKHQDPGLLPEADTLTELLKEQGAVADNRTSYTFHDTDGNVRYTVDEKGFCVEHRYDIRGLKIATIRYQEPISDANLALLKTAKTIDLEPNPSVDRYQRFFYDADGHLVAKQDAAGYLTEYELDVEGKVIHSIAYSATASFSGDFPAIRPSQNTDDAHHYYFRNNLGQITMEVDPDNFVSTYQYYANGLKQDETHYYNALSSDWDRSKQPAVPATHSEDRNVSYQYDEMNRLVQTIDPYGVSHAKKYDVMGNLLLDREYDYQAIKDPFDDTNQSIADPDKCRTNQKQYDQWNQVIQGVNKRVGTLIAAIETNPKLTPEQKQEQVSALWANKSSRYSYDSSGLKLSAVNSLGQETQYFYDSERRLVLVIDPAGTATQHTYNSFHEKLSTRQYYNQVDVSKLPADREDGFITSAVEALLQINPDKDMVDQYTYDARGKLQTHTDPELNVTTFEYNAWGEVKSKLLPVNSKQGDLTVAYEYDARGNWTSESKTSGTKSITHKRTFNNLHNKIDSETDAEKNTTTYQYDHRGNTAKVIDAAKVTQHDRQYDAFNRLLTDKMPNGTQTHTYNQQKRQHVINHPRAGAKTVNTHNAFGEMIAQQDALALLNNYAKKWTHDAQGKVAVETDQLGNQHETARDTEGKLLTHTYPALSYDAAPRVDKSEYTLAGFLSALTIDAAGLALKHGYSPNAFGFNEALTDPRGVITQNALSKRGELMQAIKDYGTQDKPGIRQVEAYTYNGQKTKQSYTQGGETTLNQYAVDFEVDGFNRNVGKTVDPKARAPEGVTAIESNQANLLNDNGHVIRHTDPRGFNYYLFYDVRGMLRFKVNADLSVFEMQYDQKGNLRLKRTYTQRVAAGQIDETKSLADVEKIMSGLIDSDDTQNYHFYNADNQLQFVVSIVDGQGIITEHLFDIAGRDIGQIAHATLMPGDFTTITTADIEAWVADPANKNPDDRALRHVLDECGHKRFSFQPDGSVIESRFDAYGHNIMQIQYSQFVANPEAYLNKKPADIKIPDNPAEPNHITYHIFDVRNKPQFTVLGNAVIGYQHDENGNVTQECHYADTITVPDNYDDLVKLCRSLVPNRDKDKVKDFAYDNLNHVVTVTSPNGYQDIYHRDVLGNEIEHIDRNKVSWTFEYDRAKRQVIKNLPPISIPDVKTDPATKKLANTGLKLIATIEKTEYDKSNNVTAKVHNYGQPNQRRADMTYSPLNHLDQLLIQNIPVDDRTKPASFDELPTKLTDLTHNVVTDTKGKKVCIQGMNGIWEFNVYDSAERHIYKLKERGGKLYVTEYVRNAFGEQLKLIKYENPLTIDYKQYTTTGIPRSVVAENIKPDIDKDQIKEFVRSQRGHLQDVFESPVLWHMPDKDGPEVGMEKPHTQYRDDTRGKRIVIRRQRFPGHPELDFIKRQWWDDQGNLIAEAESRQLSIVDGSYLSSPVTYKVTTYQYNAKKEPTTKTEWAVPISQQPDETMSYEDLLALHTPSNDDRVHTFDHDLDSNMTKESLLNVLYSTLVVEPGKEPVIKQQVATEVSTQFGYSPVGLRTSETNAKGVTIYTFYDSRNNVLVKTGEPFTTQDTEGNPILMTPLQFIYHDEFGKKIVEEMYANGANPMTDPTQLPTPKAPDVTRDSQQFFLYDQRGSVYLEQDPNGNQKVKLYDVMRNLSRHYSLLTNYVPDDAEKPTKAVATTHIDETQSDRDDANNLTLQTQLRDHKPVFSTLQSFDSFNALVNTGELGNLQAAAVNYNLAGQEYSSNHNKKGVFVANFSDLMHQDTGYATSATEDISKLSEKDLLAIIQDPEQRAKYNINVHFTSQNGKLLREERPPVTCFDGDVAQQIQMSLSVESDLSSKTVKITWPEVVGIILSAKLTLYPANDHTKPIALTPTSSDGISQVTIDGDLFEQLTTDLYGYQLTYFGEEPVFEAVGQFVIDMGHDTDSTHLVAIAKEPATVTLLGDTEGLVSINLYQGETLIGNYPIQAAPGGRGFEVNLFDAKTAGGDPLPSGVYTIQGTKTHGNAAEMTLPVTLFTETPASTDTPLPRAIGYSAEILTHDQLGELLIWDKLPSDYQDYLVKATINYVATDGGSYTQEVNISPDFVVPDGHYVDPEGHEMNANFMFEHAVDTITNVSISLVLDDTNDLALYQSAEPLSNALKVESIHSYRGMQRKKTLTSVLKQRKEADEWEVIPGAVADSDLITTNLFASRLISYITPLPGYAGTQPDLQYFDVTRAESAGWNDIKADSANHLGVVIDVTGVAKGAYPWRVSGKTQQPTLMIASEAEQSYLSDSQDTPHMKTVLSIIDYTLDVHDNRIQTTYETPDKKGETSTVQYSKTNKPVNITNPPKRVLKDDGTLDENEVTTRGHFYDLSDKRIASKDERGAIRGIVTDEADNEVQRVLPDGVIARTVLSYDGFEKILRYHDQRQKLWQQFHDQKHQVIAVITPMNRKTAYQLNERGETLVETNPKMQAKVYGYGIKKGWLSLKQMPSGQLQIMVHHRSGEIDSTTYAAVDGDPLGQLKVSHDRDFFGVILKTTLMDGTEVIYSLDLPEHRLDFEKHAVLITSQPGPDTKQRQYRPLTSKHISSGNTSGDIWQLGALVNVPNQQLEQHWSGGMMVEQIDHAENKLARFGYDHKLRRDLRDDQTATGVHRKRSQLNPDGGIEAMRDSTASFDIQRSATGLPRRQKGQMKTPDGDTLTLDVGNTYDSADRPLIQGGAWDESKNAPVLADGQGSEFTYKNGERNTEHVLRQGEDTHTEIGLDDDSRVSTTHETSASGKIVIDTTRTYDEVALKEYVEKSTGSDKYTLTRDLTEDEDQRVTQDNTAYSANGNPTQSSTTKSFNNQGGPIKEVTVNKLTDSQGHRQTTTTTLTNGYVALDSQQLAKVNAHSDGPGGGKDLSPANQYHDSSRIMVSRTNVDAGFEGEESVEQAFDSTSDGTIERAVRFKSASGATPADLFKSGDLNENFHTPDGNLIGSYRKSRDPRDGVGDAVGDDTPPQGLQIHEKVHTFPLHGGKSAVIRGSAPLGAITKGPQPQEDNGFTVVEQDPDIVDQPVPESFADYKAQTGDDQKDGYRNYIPRPESSFPGATQSVYRPTQPMTAAQISKQMTGSEDSASEIAQANGARPLDYQYPVGFDVNIPDLQMLTFESDRNLVLSRMMALFEGSLQPHISFAPVHQKKKHHCMEKVMHIIIEIIASVVALPFKEFPGLPALIAALTDMELQALAKACHLIQHFSWAEVMDTAIAAGLTQALPSPAPVSTGGASAASSAAAGSAGTFVAQQAGEHTFFAMLGSAVEHFSVDEVMISAAEQGAINVTTQLANIAMGFQKKFDVGSVFNAMTVAVFDSGMQQIVPMPKGNGFDMVLARGAIRGAENLVESYTADVITGAPRDLEDLLANALGTSASSVMSKYMPVIHRSKPGQSSQQSQRQLRPKVTHASNMKDDKMNGLDPDYHQSMLNGLGGVNSNIATPHPGDTWQTRQANGMNTLDSNSNRPVTSNNQQRQSYGKSEGYHYAVQAANDVLHLMHVAENAGAYLLYEAAANQVEATPTHAATAAQGGSPNARVNPSKGPALFSHTPVVNHAHTDLVAIPIAGGNGFMFVKGTPESVSSAYTAVAAGALQGAGAEALKFADGLSKLGTAPIDGLTSILPGPHWEAGKTMDMLTHSALNSSLLTPHGAGRIGYMAGQIAFAFAAVEEGATGAATEFLGKGLSLVRDAGKIRLFGRGVGVGAKNSEEVLHELAKNRVQHEALKAELRQAMQKPIVTDQKLQEFIDKLYRPNAKVGSGSTADAIRHEAMTGESVGGKSHLQKGQDALVKLQKWIDKNPTSTPGNRAAVENIIHDLNDAIGNTPRPKPNL